MSKIKINQDSLKTRREWKRHKVQDGSNVFRILPPFGDPEVHNNYPYRRWSIAWMVDPKTGNRRPFASPMSDGENECPVKEYNDALTKFIDSKKADLEKAYKAKGLDDKKTEEKVKEALKSLREVQWKTKLQHVYAYNASDKSGEAGLLELKSTAHKGLKKMMSEYIKDYGQDPTCLGSDIEENAGVWFNVKKEGMYAQTTYTVAFNEIKRKENGKISIEHDREPLSENIVENYDNMGYDLNSIYTRKTYEELKDILLYNLAILAEEVPEAVIEGYDISHIEVAGSSSNEEEQETAKPASVAKKSNVTLKLDDNDDNDEDEEVQQPVRKTLAPLPKPSAGTPLKKTGEAPSKPVARKMADADVFAMADDILNG